MSRNFLFPVIVVLAAAGSNALAQSDPIAPVYNLANRHTYALTPDGMDWQTARAYSRSLGGHLVAINAVTEQSFIQSKYGGLQTSYWIGLSDHETEGVWKWDSGEPVLYANFCASEPNNWGGVEDYVEIFPAYTGGANCWNDTQSPYTGTGIAPRQGIIELAYGSLVDFETPPPGACTCPFPAPLGATTYPEGISWSGASLGLSYSPFLTTVAEEGMPVSGAQYLRMGTYGVRNVPFGGPLQRPVPPGINEVRIAIPPGTRGVSLAWDFKKAHTGGSANDGMDISVVDASGSLIANVAYADCATPQVGGTNHLICGVNWGAFVAPVGAAAVSRPLPPLPHPAYLSVVCWESEDVSHSYLHLDAIQFWGTGQFQLELSAPFGQGSVRVRNTGGGVGNLYWTGVTLDQGSFPYGWLFGLDIPPTQLFSEVLAGVPFAGTLDATGASTFTVPNGVPPGLEIYAVSLQFAGSGPLASSFLGASAPKHFTIP